MDLRIMAAAIRDIEELQPALAWLQEFGRELLPEDKPSFTIAVSVFNASGCVGAKEATKQLNAIARLHIQAIVQHAITDAENTIALRREQIAREAANG